jgi:hypothetical protein
MDRETVWDETLRPETELLAFLLACFGTRSHRVSSMWCYLKWSMHMMTDEPVNTRATAAAWVDEQIEAVRDDLAGPAPRYIVYPTSAKAGGITARPVGTPP